MWLALGRITGRADVKVPSIASNRPLAGTDTQPNLFSDWRKPQSRFHHLT